MEKIMHRRMTISLLLAGIAALLTLSPARAQSLEPMRGDIKSFAEKFALQVYPGNPYNHPIKLDLRVYDQDFKPIEATVFPSSFVIGAQEKRRVLVIVPFSGKADRKVKVCVESIPDPNSITRIRTQICGSFVAHNLH